jgi:NADPH:quinone reductase-like Zn-dependent oxidoreductase
MKAAVVTEAGKPPVYQDFREPVPGAGEYLVKVTASALSHLTKGRAAGTHYSSSGGFPFVAGVDGVGRLEDGRRAYFVLPEAPFGGMAERTLVQSSHCIFLPGDLEDVSAAALGNPGMSSWAALKVRAKLRRGETVLVNGATGIAGSLAVQIAKSMGAKKVVATGRNPEALQSLLAAGADVAISLNQNGDALDKAFQEQFAGDGIDVIVDYLWGPSAEKLLVAGAKAGREAVPIRFIQVGSVSGGTIALPSAVLRSSSIELLGSGLGSVPMDQLLGAIGDMFQAAGPGRFSVPVRTVPLADVANVWGAESSARIVITVAE